MRFLREIWRRNWPVAGRDSKGSRWLVTLLFILVCKVHLLTLLSTRPSWSPMAGSWDWTFLTVVTWHTASWLRRRKSQQRPSSLSPCRIRYKTIACICQNTIFQKVLVSDVTLQFCPCKLLQILFIYVECQSINETRSLFSRIVNSSWKKNGFLKHILNLK